MFGLTQRKAARQAEQVASVRATLTAMIGALEGRPGPTTPLMLTAGERSVYRIDNSGLFETRRGPGQWTGRSAGVSVPVGLGVRVRVGQSRGHYVQGREQPTIIDHGTVTFTNQRVVFLGAKWTREWTFSKLLGIQHFSNQPWTAIQVSNRQKTSGFTYGGLKPDIVRLWLEVALAAFHGQPGDLLPELTTQLRAIAPPPPLPMGPAESTPPGMWPGAR